MSIAGDRSNLRAPAERNVLSWHTVDSGFPNPSDEATFPLRWVGILNFGILVHLAPAG